MKYWLGLIFAVLMAPSAMAQHNHGAKGPNGGTMEDVAGVHAEFVPAGTAISFNFFDEANKPLSTKDYVASALVVTGPDRETVKLVQSGDASLRADVKKAVAVGTQVTLMVKTAAGKSAQVRFKVEK